jgi:hypothetical protein
MKKIGKILKTIYWVITMLALILTMTAATYAWFSSNRTVGTEDSVSGRTGSDTVKLEISKTGGSSFKGEEEASMVQVNKTTATSLLPVSTADLKTFVYSPGTAAGMASSFQVVEQEDYYYHGRVYVRATAEGQDTSGKMAVYLDQGSDSGGAIAQAASGDLLNASRLGLTFDGENSVIFKLSNTSNTSKKQVRNTVLGGSVLSDDQVLGYSNKKVTGVKDPSVFLSQYTISVSDDTVSLPDAPLTYLELNKIYPVDIYFYLEGCDPDCSDSISYDEAELHLAFYGILE